jgi:hypothetical protein
MAATSLAATAFAGAGCVRQRKAEQRAFPVAADLIAELRKTVFKQRCVCANAV